MRTAERQLGALLERARRGEPDAIGEIDRFVAENGNDDRLVLARAELASALGLEDALSGLEAALEQQPFWIEGQRTLAELRYERLGEKDCGRTLRRAIERNPKEPRLWNAYIALMGDIGEQAAAADTAQAAQRFFDLPILRMIEANHASTAGLLERAERLYRELPETLPDLRIGKAKHRIRGGDFEDAARLIDEQLAKTPEDLSYWALRDLVWRALDDERAEWLSTDPRFCQTFDLGLGEGKLVGLAELLRGLHQARGRPIGQSARGGTQTRGPLFARDDRPIAHLHELLQRSVNSYRAALPPRDQSHPLLAHKDRSMSVVGGWSIRLSGKGHHVPHIHPAGMVSSACYIIVPDVAEGSMEGHFELGRPPQDLRMDLDPITTVAPQPGRLVLFPSYLYHGTHPFAKGERLTVAFDATAAR